MGNFKVCCGFGHRELHKNIEKELDAVIAIAVRQGCTVFMTGGNGEFDTRFSCAVRKAKRQAPHIRLELIKPYFSNSWNTQKEYYRELYDAIVVPDELSNLHYKSAITACNRWMVDRSDFVIACVYRQYGGAYTAVRYAQKQGKEILYMNK